MKIGNFDTRERVMVVAEIGNNHEGSINTALEMVRVAAEVGADAVKFQTFRTEHYVSPDQTERVERLNKFRLSDEQFMSLAQKANDLGLIFFSTPFDLESVQSLDRIVPVFKVSSGDNTFYPLLEAIARTAKPVILSTGLADLNTVRYAKNVFEMNWAKIGVRPEFSCLHCVSAYPTPTEEANLGAIRALQDEFNCTVGYSDHTLGIDAAVLSVGLGARIIEKHFTLDKAYSDFRDHALSADPIEFKNMVKSVRHAQSLLGTGAKAIMSSEAGSADAVRRSICIAQDAVVGTVLRSEHLTWLRPGSGMPPGSEVEILGKKLKATLRAGSQITLDLLE